MKTTKEERDAIRLMIDEADGDCAIEIASHIFVLDAHSSETPIVLALLDDADRGQELEAEVTRLTKVILDSSGCFTTAQVKAILETKGDDS